MSHANARLTPRARLELVQQIQAGWSVAEVARQFRVARATATKWLRRFEQQGEAGLQDRSSAPRRRPRRTADDICRRICAVRQATGWRPHRIAWALHLARQTVSVVLKRAGLNRLQRLHRVTRQPVRYGRETPGELLHIDVKKQGRIPDGGGKRFAPGFAATHSGPHAKRSRGREYLHVAVDDHSRYAYVEALPDDGGLTSAAFLARALEHFRQRGIWVQRVLSENARAYRSGVFTAVAAARGVRLKRTRPYRPETNGKVGRFNQTLQAEWSYARKYRSNEERLAELPRWLYRYHYRRRTAASRGPSPPPDCHNLCRKYKAFPCRGR